MPTPLDRIKEAQTAHDQSHPTFDKECAICRGLETARIYLETHSAEPADFDILEATDAGHSE